MMNLNIEYSTRSNFSIERKGGVVETPQLPQMEVKLEERIFRIIRTTKKETHCFHNSKCAPSTISVIFFSSQDEISAFVKKLENTETFPCYRVENFEDHAYISCSEKEALQAVKAVIEVSKNHFGALQKDWMAQAKKFITNGPEATVKTTRLSWPSDLEASIRQKMGNQEGAMALVEALKKLPFQSDVKTILLRLDHGKYGELSSNEVSGSLSLACDLERRDFNELAKLAGRGEFEHDGPKEMDDKNISNLLQLLFKSFAAPIEKHVGA